MTGFEKGGHFVQNAIFCHLNLPPFQGSESLGLQTWFVSSLGLPLHRSNVRTLSKPPFLSSEPLKRGIKRRFSNTIDAAARRCQSMENSWTLGSKAPRIFGPPTPGPFVTRHEWTMDRMTHPLQARTREPVRCC